MSYFNRRHILGALIGAALAAVPSQACHAAFYPEQLIKVIVTFPPGGSADIVIRALEPLVAAELKRGLVIENRAGAGGNIGMAVVAQAKPDGYALGIARQRHDGKSAPQSGDAVRSERPCPHHAAGANSFRAGRLGKR